MAENEKQRFRAKPQIQAENIKESDLLIMEHQPNHQTEDADYSLRMDQARKFFSAMEKLRAEEAEELLKSFIDLINSKIPSAASETNKLADIQYVNESIQTNTAVNRGDFATYAELEAYEGPVTRNDYATVRDDETHDHECWRYKWNDEEETWKPEYRINESPMTQAQLAALNSGITEEKVEKLDSVEEGAQVNTVNSVNGLTGDVEISGLTVDSSLSKTSENPVQNKVITNNIFTYINTQSTTAAKTINFAGITGNTPPDGFYCKVMFKNGHNGTTLIFNGISVKVNKGGSLIPIPYHTIDGTNKILQKYTVLEMYYDDSESCWVVIGNPEVITYTSETVSYRIKADGLIDMWGLSETSIVGVNIITFPVILEQVEYINIIHKSGSSANVATNYIYNQYTSVTTSQLTFSCAGAERQNGYSWEVKGY